MVVIEGRKVDRSMEQWGKTIRGINYMKYIVYFRMSVEVTLRCASLNPD